MEHKTNIRVFLALVLLSATLLSYYNGVIKAYAIENSPSTTSQEAVVVLDESTAEPVEPEPIVVEKVITVEKKVEVEKVVKPFKLKDLGVFKVTAYCPCEICCGEWTDSAKTKITSIGAGAYEGVTIAVDPTQIPYGTKLFGAEFGVRIATDCGGAIKGKRLDLYFSSHAKALEFGVKNVHLYAIED